MTSDPTRSKEPPRVSTSFYDPVLIEFLQYLRQKGDISNLLRMSAVDSVSTNMETEDKAYKDAVEGYTQEFENAGQNNGSSEPSQRILCTGNVYNGDVHTPPIPVPEPTPVPLPPAVLDTKGGLAGKIARAGTLALALGLGGTGLGLGAAALMKPTPVDTDTDTRTVIQPVQIPETE